ncbi:MoaD and/or ThiS family protein [Pseudonocardia sp. Ae168_Ps1]|nr:MoaD and/or ThiS family protein [Pseudonocardia sp. Ae150A_Ps1]OLL82130.1 MoaD and/or ThiS family protein [Pseudonocardia sp. Ae168_Ps1]OLL83756.1 MoaD and/or ThiS family protein [Pseudonocardia sp. Ae263_Ps1]OLL90204.1 MoaD and/or ThiS family protein [Pseudonocardia sp. Ae356_Ps1]
MITEMAVSVSIPTILRTHTGGEKTVEAKGDTVAGVIDDLESRHSGIKGRLITDGKLHRFVNIYVDDEDVRFAGGLEAPVKESSTLTILPAVAGGR